MGNFDVTTPVGSDLLSQGDDKIREFKLAVREALRAGAVAGDDIEGVEAIFPGASPSSDPVYRYRGLKGTTAARPTAGQYGLYFDTTRNVVQRDNGTTWDDVATVIPSGTKIVFYQASAPVGWTAVAVNDKFLRVVTAGGTGGSNGGTGLTPSSSLTLAHTHTIASHSHTVPNHVHYFAYEPLSFSGDFTAGNGFWTLESDGDNAAYVKYASIGGAKTLRDHKYPRTTSSGSSTSGSVNLTPDSALTTTAFQYADVIVASKD